MREAAPPPEGEVLLHRVPRCSEGSAAGDRLSKHRRAERLASQEQKPPSKRRHTIEGDVSALLSKRSVSTWVGPDRRDEAETTLVYRDRVRDSDDHLVPVPTVSPTERARRAAGFSYEIEMPALLDQLEQLRASSRSDVEMSSGRRTPSSRPPDGATYAELLVDMAAGSAQLRRDALTALGRERELVRRHQGHVVPLHADTATNLRALLDLIDYVDEDLAGKISKQIRSWTNAARLLLSINAPMAKLEWPCPMCGEQSLIVRADASTDVVCANRDCVDDAGNKIRWPRSRWAMLLEAASD